MEKPIEIADFVGCWQIARDISDHRGQNSGLFKGQVDFTPTGAGLLCHENGVLQMDGQGSFTATRDYLWRDAKGRIEIDFADGRYFHGFDPHLAKPTAHHDCPPDTYVVHYDFAHWPQWECHWRVTGPRKDYEMVSRYRRE